MAPGPRPGARRRRPLARLLTAEGILMPEYKLPDVGEGLTEAEIVTWKVKVGDVIAVNDIVVEIETAKSLVELPSPYAGTVTGLLVPEGETVPVGTPIIAIGDEASAPAPTPPRRRDPQADPGEIDLSNPARQRWRRGREPGRPQQGRARLPAPAAQGDLARGGRRAALDPRAGRRVVRPGRAGARRRSSRPTSRPCRRTRRRPRRRAAGSNGDVRTLAKPPGPQAGQGPRRRHHVADRLRRRWRRDAAGRRGRVGLARSAVTRR